MAAGGCRRPEVDVDGFRCHPSRAGRSKLAVRVDAFGVPLTLNHRCEKRPAANRLARALEMAMSQERMQASGFFSRFGRAPALKLGALGAALWLGGFVMGSDLLLPQSQSPPAEVDPAPSRDRDSGPGSTSPANPPRRTLKEIVTVIERIHGVSIVIDHTIPENSMTAVDPVTLSLDAVLRQAFQGFDLFIQYGPSPVTGEMQLRRAWVFPAGHGPAMEAALEAAEPEEPPRSSTTKDRIAAIHKLGEPPGRDIDPQETLRWAVSDPDDNVRHQALIAAQANGIRLEEEAIETILATDSSEIVRLAALEALTLNPDIAPYRLRARLLDLARGDPSLAIRDMAAALLKHGDSDSLDAYGAAEWGITPPERP